MIKLYAHGGSGNHGCEAIVRSTKKIIDESLQLYSANPTNDYQYGINEIVEIKDDTAGYIKKKSILHGLAALQHKLFHSDYLFNIAKHKRFLNDVSKGDICLSIGGDNYCYSGTDILTATNCEVHRRGAKTILWGCSIDAEVLENPLIVKDMKRYNLITVRETISQNNLASKGIITNVKLVSDPAFQLEKVELPLPPNFKVDNTVGINASPLILDREGIDGIAVKNFINMIQYILVNTDMNILLLPHVVLTNTDDRVVLKEIYKQFSDNNRICLLDDYNCEELKGFISRCRFFVGARTHATIAAYSTCVPTLVVGYSTKAKGIAKDLFGTSDHYVIPVQALTNENELTEGFKWIMDHELEIKQHLSEIIPEYKENALLGAKYLNELR